MSVAGGSSLAMKSLPVVFASIFHLRGLGFEECVLRSQYATKPKNCEQEPLHETPLPHPLAKKKVPPSGHGNVRRQASDSKCYNWSCIATVGDMTVGGCFDACHNHNGHKHRRQDHRVGRAKS